MEPNVVKTTVQPYPEDDMRTDITFLVEADDPGDAYEMANSSLLVAEGSKICRKEGLPSPCASDLGTPITCDAEGKPYPPTGEFTPVEGRKYYCYRTIKFTGDDS